SDAILFQEGVSVKLRLPQNETTINDGGIQTVSANGEAIKTKINEGGTLTVNDNGKATDIVQNSGAALQTSTANGIEISGTHQYGT
ncbi:hypothetical protein UL79_23415, partial [Shigella dysenteriae]|uniref:AIDA repeat-containing protein n=1 Tax=Shigella dysenteriae TaxID=622 RepID=UPI000ECDD092